LPVHEVEDEEIQDSETPFDEKELEEAWDYYSKSFLKDKPKYSSIINNYKPVLKDDYVLLISFENSFQLELFREFKHELAIFLRKKLNNSLISFAEEVVEQENSKTKIYTVDDKFRFMSQKNPNLIKLKQQLNLDFD
jgi:DNA polymerase-3 subunit gamma/tau